MDKVNYLIAGGGGAGLGLAYALIASPLKDASIVIVDRDSKNQNDRTWCFWGGPDAPFAHIAAHSWQKIAVRSEGFERVFDLASEGESGWRYWMVRGIDFYRHTRAALERMPNVRFIQGSVDCLEERADEVVAHVGDQAISARWAFDSIIRPGEISIDSSRYHNLKQHFLGWEIEAEQPVFQPDVATMFDFSTPQHDDLRFMYVLPFSETRALVEYTIFSAQLLERDQYAAELRGYITRRLGIQSYTVHAEEQGSIPMTDYPFARRVGERILNIGTKGGLVKPSTGYAFQRMQEDARAVVRSLVRHGHPFEGRSAPARYRFYDTLLLQILTREGSQMKPIFVQLFARNPIMRVFHFLNEDAPFRQDLALIASLPPWPFLRALARVKLLRKI